MRLVLVLFSIVLFVFAGFQLSQISAMNVEAREYGCRPTEDNYGEGAICEQYQNLATSRMAIAIMCGSGSIGIFIWAFVRNTNKGNVQSDPNISTYIDS